MKAVRLAGAPLAALGLALGLALTAAPVTAVEGREPPSLAEAVAKGQLPPVDKRLPASPHVTATYGEKGPGRPGGELATLVGAAREPGRHMTVYGNTRLMAYDASFVVQPDLLESLTVEQGRVFTLKLRRGHKWSDGHPFTSEDFRYWWEDIVNNTSLGKGAVPQDMLVDGKPPKVEFLDETTIRYSWEQPNKCFVEAMARPLPLFLYRPAHYLKKFHSRYVAAEELAKEVAAARQPDWTALHQRRDVMYANDNVDLPRLDPWINTTRGGSQRFVFVRNPYFHRVDGSGMQLPYIDRLIFNVVSAGLIPSKAGLGESDLQFRYLRFADNTFLREGAKKFPVEVRIWDTGNGSQLALYPNLTVNDPEWRKLMRDVRFRRALSLAIDRDEINESVYQGLAHASNNTVLPRSPLFSEALASRHTKHDAAAANKLLDEIGLKARDSRGVRLRADGKPIEIILETAGESDEENDILTLIAEQWIKVGIKMVAKPQTRENLRLRTFSGEAVMTVWTGIENAVPRPQSCPGELAPTTKGGLQWAKWGEYTESGGKSGQPCDLPAACELLTLHAAWHKTGDAAEEARIWQRMLEIHADQQFTIGTVNGTPQPLVVKTSLRNVPKKAIYAWHPTGFIGAYRPDLIWLEGK